VIEQRFIKSAQLNKQKISGIRDPALQLEELLWGEDVEALNR
jgi:hypothetical protein